MCIIAYFSRVDLFGYIQFNSTVRSGQVSKYQIKYQSSQVCHLFFIKASEHQTTPLRELTTIYCLLSLLSCDFSFVLRILFTNVFFSSPGNSYIYIYTLTAMNIRELVCARAW
jgi:hypothetical protein